MKILFAVDGSEPALAALDVLIARMRWFAGGATLTLVNVHPQLPYAGAAAWAGKDAVQGYYDEEAQKALQPAIDRLDKAGIKAEKVTLVGDPGEAIAAYAHEHKHDLIALGTRGRTALSNLVLGSVATKVLAHSKLPVLLLR